MNTENIQGLDTEAWERWVAYRKAIRKPLKEISLHAAALKLAKYGSDQSEVVSQSISNQWQGLFELKKSKPMPGEKVEKTDKQKAADAAAFEALQGRNQRFWQDEIGDPIMRLRLCDALLARYTLAPQDGDTAEKIEHLKTRIGEFMRMTEPKKVYDDPHLRFMIWQLFGDRGMNRLKSMANA